MRRPLELISQPDFNATSSNTPSTMPATIGQRKYVVAHHMVGNTYPYTQSDWLDDISLAYAAGIDGFALNMGRDDWQTSRVADAYDAALQSKLDFKLFISLDMSSFSGSSSQDAHVLRDIVRTYLSHPNQLQYASRAVVSTFSGESCTFGQDSSAEGWRDQFVSHPDLIGRLYFVPSFFIDPKSFGEYRDVINGDFAWNTGWPVQLTSSLVQSLISDISSGSISSAVKGIGVVRRLWNSASSVQDQVQTLLAKYIGSMTDDKAHLNALAALGSGTTSVAQQRRGETERRAYMAPVSPWFFTHYGPDSYNKNFVYLSDYWLYLKRWESLIAARDQVDFVELISWNDYGESHYVGPIKGAQPNSQAWTNGFDHTAWLNITKYYSAAFKSGSYPPIEADQIYMWARPHPANASASDDPVGPPSNGDLFQDVVWVAVMATRNSTVVLCTDSSLSSDQQSTFDVPAGLSRLSVPIKPGGIMYGAIRRGNQTLVELRPHEFVFNGSPTQYNFNVFIAGAQASSQS
ncbi:hypothetical protein APHAL10511_002691 [Amanita phalloides]|nr:hypothetical protein APHAL10511_002691 [Amanita phalloides]